MSKHRRKALVVLYHRDQFFPRKQYEDLHRTAQDIEAIHRRRCNYPSVVFGRSAWNARAHNCWHVPHCQKDLEKFAAEAQCRRD